MLTCECCGYTGPEVQVIECGYSLDVLGKSVEETICPECEAQHCDDI